MDAPVPLSEPQAPPEAPRPDRLTAYPRLMLQAAADSVLRQVAGEVGTALVESVSRAQDSQVLIDHIAAFESIAERIDATLNSGVKPTEPELANIGLAIITLCAFIERHDTRLSWVIRAAYHEFFWGYK